MMDPSKEKRENTELEQQSTNINEGRVQREKEAEIIRESLLKREDMGIFSLGI